MRAKQTLPPRGDPASPVRENHLRPAPTHPTLALHRAAGNRAVIGLLRKVIERAATRTSTGNGGPVPPETVQRKEGEADKKEDPSPHSRWTVKTPQGGNLLLRVVADHPTELTDGTPNSVGNLASGTIVEVIEKKNDLGWYQVTGEVGLDGGKREVRTGFVHRKYLFPVAAAEEPKTPAGPPAAEQAAPPAANADPVLDAITSPSALISHFTSYLNLDEDALGAELRRRALRGEHAFVSSVFDELGSTDRDDVALGFMAAAKDQDVAGLLTSTTGRALLDRLYDELTAGSVSVEEAAGADRILKAKSSLIPVEQFAAAAMTAKIFPLRMPGLTVLDDAPISAERRPGGKIWVKQPVRVLGTTKFAAEVRTLPTGVFTGGVELPENEVVGVKLYDMGGPVVYRPALYLVELNNQTNTKILEKMVETAGLALGVVGGGVAAGASTLAKIAVWADRIALAIGTLASVIQEHRGWIIEKFGESGKKFLGVVDVVNSVVAIYGITRAAIGAVQLMGALRTAYRNWRAAATGLEELSQNERSIVAKTSSSTEEVLDNVDKIQAEQRASAAAPKGGEGPGAAEPGPKPAVLDEPAPVSEKPRLAAGAAVPEAEAQAGAFARRATLDGAHDVKLTDAGDLVRCSPICTRLRTAYESQLPKGSPLEVELADIERRAASAARSKNAAEAKVALDQAIALENKLASSGFDSLRKIYPELTPSHVAAVRARGVDSATLETLLRIGKSKGLKVEDAVLIAETGGLRGVRDAATALEAPGGTVADALDAAMAAEQHQPGIRPPKSVTRHPEVTPKFKGATPEEAYAAALENARIESGLGANEIPFRSDIGPKKGQISGRMAPDGTHGWRLDFDPDSDKLFHINWWRTDAKGYYSGANVVVGGTQAQYEALMKALAGGG